MKYKIEDLERMSKEDLIKTYREAKTSVKKYILTSLANSGKFAVLIDSMYLVELEQMAKIHPYKEVIVDTMIDEMEAHGIQMAKYFEGNHFQRESFNKFMDALQHKSFFTKMKETFTRKPALPESLPKKIEQVKKLCEVEVRRTNATGKKMEQLETQGLEQAVDESRVEVNNGEMAKVFDRYAKEARKKGKFFGMYEQETEIAQNLKTQLTKEYISILGARNQDIAYLVANAEFESYSGKTFSLPYNGTFRAKSYDSRYHSESIGATTDSRGWQKNLLEVEKVEGFTVEDQNLGKVFIVKSEFSPTSYAIEGKWAPVYEYYIKGENGEFTCIGGGKINEQTGKMETTISTNGQDVTKHLKFNDKDAITKGKEDGTILQFNSSEYAGTSTKTSRKDIEQTITTKAIQNHLGKGKQIAEITQVKDIPIVTYDDEGNPQTKNAYMVACVENGVESYEMICIGEDGKCKTYPGMTKDIFAKKQLCFPTGMSTPDGMWIEDTKQALEIFKTRDGIQYSAYRDKDGNLRVAQLMDRVNGNGKYAEELDTYTVMHGDIEKMKVQSKEDYDKERKKEKQTKRDGYEKIK